MPPRRILLPQVTPRDRLNLDDERIRARFAIVEREEPPPDGVFGSSDATARLAAETADRLGLPSPGLAAFMRCHDKLTCREVGARAVPEATPRFAEVDAAAPPAEPPLPLPFFLKPARAHLSQHASRIDSAEGFRVAVEAAAADGFTRLIAEELLDGDLVTFEGFVAGGVVTTVGVTDAVLHENGISFMRFEYPSRLPAHTTVAMSSVAERLMPALGFDQSLFNIEFFVTPRGVRLVEVNGRVASQFGPLVRAVHGVSTYELGLELAAGGRPTLPPPQPGRIAASFVQRTWRDARVLALPDMQRVHDRFPDAVVEVLVRPGQRLSENDDDPLSHRLCTAALSAEGHAALLERWAHLEPLLGFQLEPVDQNTDEHQATRSA
jgi:hypothetical protein